MIELIVVLSIMAILILFSFPVFRDNTLFSDSKSRVGDIVRLVNDLKKRAVEQNIDFLMHIDTGTNLIWVTDVAMGDGAKETARENSAKLSDDISILDIEFPDNNEAGGREYQIRFRQQGYSDFALIHIIEGENNITLKIEPFLSQVQLLDKHVYFKDCM